MSANTNNQRIAGREPFLGFVTDDTTLDVVQAVLIDQGWRPEACRKGALRAASQALATTTSPAMLLVDLSDSSDPLHDVDSLAEVCEPGTIVFALGQVNDVSLYRELVARGIYDYLVKPLSAAHLSAAFERARAAMSAARANDDDGELKSLSTAVVGTRGGVGASMVATSLAWVLGAEHKRSTALLDLDIHFGTGALTLDIEPGRGLTDAIENPGRIDGLFIERAMTRASDALAIMSSEAPLGASLVTDGAAFLQLQQEMRQSFAACVIDLPRSVMINFPQIVVQMDVVIVTTEMTLASARDAIRILAWLKSVAPDTQTILVANNVQPGAIEISLADFTAAVERPVDHSLAYDHKAAVNAARLGQTFAEANRASKTAAPLFDLAKAIVAPGEPVEGKPDHKAAASSLLGLLDWKALLTGKNKLEDKQARRAA